eukprot:COSAG05_NODE_6887_length_887_cov_0.983503_1_plen_49_part_10
MGAGLGDLHFAFLNLLLARSPLSVSALLWCAKNAIYIQLWPLGTLKVEK